MAGRSGAHTGSWWAAEPSGQGSEGLTRTEGSSEGCLGPRHAGSCHSCCSGLTPGPCPHVPSTEQVCPVEGRQIGACLEACGRPSPGKGVSLRGQDRCEGGLWARREGDEESALSVTRASPPAPQETEQSRHSSVHQVRGEAERQGGHVHFPFQNYHIGN